MMKPLTWMRIEMMSNQRLMLTTSLALYVEMAPHAMTCEWRTILPSIVLRMLPPTSEGGGEGEGNGQLPCVCDREMRGLDFLSQ